MAANYYQIEEKVLDRVGELSSTKGGSVARKAEGRTDSFTKQETRFLESAAIAFTRRAAGEGSRSQRETTANHDGRPATPIQQGQGMRL